MPLPRPPPKGGTGGKPIIPGASPRRRCPTAGATGFGFLASNQGITNTPGTAHAPTAGHLRGLAAHITHTGRTKAEPAREGSQEGLPSCQKPPNPPGGPGTAASALEAAPSTLQEPGAVGCAWEAHPAPQGGRGRQGPAGLTRRRPGPAGYVASNSTGTPQPEAGCGWAQATSPGLRPSTLPDLQAPAHQGPSQTRCPHSEHPVASMQRALQRYEEKVCAPDPHPGEQLPVAGHAAFPSGPQQVSAGPGPLCCDGCTSPAQPLPTESPYGQLDAVSQAQALGPGLLRDLGSVPSLCLGFLVCGTQGKGEDWPPHPHKPRGPEALLGLSEPSPHL